MGHSYGKFDGSLLISISYNYCSFNACMISKSNVRMADDTIIPQTDRRLATLRRLSAHGNTGMTSNCRLDPRFQYWS